MTPITVDINARIVSDTTEVFVARPGRSYSLYGTFIKEHLIGPELPLLELTQDRPLFEHKDLDARIRRSRALRDWHRNRSTVPENLLPNLDLSYYSLSLGKRIGNMRRVLSLYFSEMKIGDLVLVPPSSYGNDAYIGEVTSANTKYVEFTVPEFYGRYPLSGRRVNWLATIPKRRLPTDILDALEHPVAIYELAKRLRPPIYEAAFGTYYDLSGSDQDFTARFDVKSLHFSTDTDFRLQAFFNAVASNIKAIDEGRALKAPHSAAFDDLGDYAAFLRSNINSPGSMTLFAKRVTPVVAAVLFALASDVGPDAVSAADKGLITIGNSKAPHGDQCTATIFKSVLDQIKLLGLDKWPEACELARRAGEGSGASSNVTVTK